MKKINVAELLKNCPKGMELDCTMYEDVYFDYVDELNVIHCYIQHETHKTSITLNQHGTPNSDIKSKCVIFPKGKTTWEGFIPPCRFKVGDIIQDIDAYKVKITEINIDDECYGYESIIVKGIGSIPFNEQDNWKLVPNKFDINTLVPFESRVLVRTKHFHDTWTSGFFSHIDSNGFAPFWTTADKNYQQCIPYEGNEHLLGKTDDCDEYFKTWK